jgi:predicted CXXCH cytochrome family protein
LDDLHGPGAPIYQGSASVELPAQRWFEFEVTDGSRLAEEVSRELVRLGQHHRQSLASDDEALVAAIVATRRGYQERHLVELGVGCEACHGGSAEHVRAPSRFRPTFAVQSDFVQLTRPGGGVPSAAQDLNRACARCHTVLFTRYPFTWEGGDRKHQPGGSHINSGEARDFLLGGCSSELACTRCHDPHGGDKRRVTEIERSGGKQLCTSCHSQLRDAAAIRRHTHHDPDGRGSACIECHMPKKNMGLDYRLTRYHRIGSPTDLARVELDRPLECALCHPNEPVTKLVQTMERWWGKRYDQRALRELYGDLDESPITTTLIGGKAHERATAAAVAGEHRMTPLLPLLVQQLDNEYPLVRFFAHHALEQASGEDVSLDLHAPAAALIDAGQRWLSSREAKDDTTRPATRPLAAPKAAH